MTKKLYSLAGVAAMLLVMLSIPAAARSKTMSWTGWLSDSSCGARGMTASHKQCALACVHEKGAEFVLVTEDKAVHPISNQKAVKDSDVGQEVRVTGHMSVNGSIVISRISPEM